MVSEFFIILFFVFLVSVRVFVFLYFFIEFGIINVRFFVNIFRFVLLGIVFIEDIKVLRNKNK